VHARSAPSNSAPPLRTYCVESDDGPVATAVPLARDAHDPSPGLDGTDPGETDPGESGAHMVVLEAPVFLEQSRALTAHPPSPRRGRTRRRAPSERARQVRRAHGGRGRRGRRIRRPASGAQDDDGSSTWNPVAVSSHLDPSRVCDMHTCGPRFGRPGTGRAAAGLHFGLWASVSAPQYGNRAPVRPSTLQVGWHTFRTMYSASHKTWIRMIRFSNINHLLSQ